MNDTYDNNGLNDLQSVLRMYGQRGSSSQSNALEEKTTTFLNERDVALPVINGQEFIALCNNDVLTNPDCIDFSSLTAKQKTFISIVHASAQYIRELYICRNTTIPTIYRCADYFDALQDISRLQVLRDSFSGNDPNKPFNIASRNKFSSKFFNYSTRPSLEDVFNQLTQIKLSFRYLVELFYYYFGILKNFPLDRRISDILIQIVTEEDYEQFHGLIKEWDELVVYQMSIMIDIIYPLLHYYESHITDYENILSCINKDLTSKEYNLELSPIRVIINFLIIYIFKNNVQQYLADFELNSYNTFFNNKTTRFEVLFYSWIDSEIELLSDYFNNLSNNNQSENPTQNNTIKKANNDSEKGLTSINTYLEPTHVLDDSKEKGEEKGEEKHVIKDCIHVPCGQKMLIKFTEGLIDGHKDETLGNFSPLVTSKTGEDRESIKKKLICLFTGEGINDESIKWPYNLEWKDKGNSLKLLIYLLHYEGILLDPLEEAINENDVEGISDKVRTDFTGKPVWKIVGTALGYKENSLRNKNKIPKRSNLSLMKKIAQFWSECKKLDD